MRVLKTTKSGSPTCGNDSADIVNGQLGLAQLSEDLRVDLVDLSILEA